MHSQVAWGWGPAATPHLRASAHSKSRTSEYQCLKLHPYSVVVPSCPLPADLPELVRVRAVAHLLQGMADAFQPSLRGAWRNRLVLSAGHSPAPTTGRSSAGPAEDNDGAAEPPEGPGTNAVNGPALSCVLRHLQPNDKATTGRLLCKDAAFWLGSVPDRTVDISKPLPPHVAASAPHFAAGAQAQLHDVPLRRKLLWLAAAAASGSGANVQVAWRALEPRLFPELLQSRYYTALFPGIPDPGTAAVEAGHPQLVPELLDLCPGLIRPTGLLAAVAHHVELSDPYGLKATWQRLHATDPHGMRSTLDELHILTAAMSSKLLDAEDKVAWLVKNGATLGPNGRNGGWRTWQVLPDLAARAGGLHRLKSVSSPFYDGYNTRRVLLVAALEHCDALSVRWLVDTGRCELPEAEDISGEWFARRKDRDVLESRVQRDVLESWARLVSSAAKSEIDGVRKLQLLWKYWAPMDVDWVLVEAAVAAAGAGRLDCLRYLRDCAGEALMTDPTATELALQAVKSDSMQTVEWLLRQGCAFSSEALLEACSNGNLAMVQWLLQEAKVRPDGVDLGKDVIAAWPYGQGCDSSHLLQAVKLLLAAAAAVASAAQAEAAALLHARDYDPPVLLSSALPAAASRGDLALVRYLVEELQLQRELSAEVISAAAGSGCEALLEWLAREQGCPVRGPDAWVRAGRLGDRAVLGCLLRLGVPWGQGLARAAADAGLPGPVLDWMEAEGARLGRGGGRGGGGRRGGVVK